MNAKLLSVLLAYPDEELIDALPELLQAAAELPRDERRTLARALTAAAPCLCGEITAGITGDETRRKTLMAIRLRASSALALELLGLRQGEG